MNACPHLHGTDTLASLLRDYSGLFAGAGATAVDITACRLTGWLGQGVV